MPRQLAAALGAVMVVAAFTLAPALAGERATLKVTARVVDRCTVEVPASIPPWLWRDRGHQPWRLVHQRCHGKPPFWVHAKKVLLEHLRDHSWPGRGRDHGRRHETRHPSRYDVVLITITY
jgi:hypothetical protein